MKPRIFVSSTFYDLKYVREDLANFIRSHDFEPIMFEEGDVGYTPGKPLDASCYETMQTADMVLLIIGSTYGSAVTGEKSSVFEEYLSITRKEFQTAVNEGIPIYAFIESSVYTEYGVYESNIKNIEDKSIQIVFKAAKNINVFRFIKEIYSMNEIVVTDFKKTSEIKEFMSKQWSDMFKKYLQSLKEEKNSEKIYEAMDSMKTLIKQMGVMVDGLGKKIIGNEDGVDYKELRKRQLEIKVNEIVKNICERCNFYTDDMDNKLHNINTVFPVLLESIDMIRNKHLDIDFSENDKIREILIPLYDKLFKQEHINYNISLNFFKEWESIIDIVDDEEVQSEVREKLLQDGNYQKLFSLKSEKKKEE